MCEHTHHLNTALLQDPHTIITVCYCQHDDDEATFMKFRSGMSNEPVCRFSVAVTFPGEPGVAGRFTVKEE